MATQTITITNGVPSGTLTLDVAKTALQIAGADGGGEFLIEASHNGTTWSAAGDITGAVRCANGFYSCDFPISTQIRITPSRNAGIAHVKTVTFLP